MYPAKPPLPWPRYLPFQPVSGSQTSISMAESFAGLMVACTRQKAGRFFPENSDSLSRAGGTKAPAATCSADVMVVSGSLSVARLSQLAAKMGLEIDNSTISRRQRLRSKRAPQVQPPQYSVKPDRKDSWMGTRFS